MLASAPVDPGAVQRGAECTPIASCLHKVAVPASTASAASRSERITALLPSDDAAPPTAPHALPTGVMSLLGVDTMRNPPPVCAVRRPGRAARQLFGPGSPVQVEAWLARAERLQGLSS